MAVRFIFLKYWMRGTFMLAILFLCGQILAQDSTENEVEIDPIEAVMEEHIEISSGENAENRLPIHDANYKIEPREIKTETWADATKSLDYSKDKAKITEAAPPVDLPNWGFNTNKFGGLVQGILIALGLALIGYLIFRIVTGARSKTVKPAEFLDISSLDDLENHLFETDLQKMLRVARESGQFGLAIRVHYLMIIRQLSEKNYVKWRREKTNRNYSNELAASQFAADFKKITPIYEQIWYGEKSVSAAQFTEIEPYFETFFRKI
jgi:Domain of unknown function (DUF4129)